MAGAIVPVERIESRILVIRGLKVMLDVDLAELYGVPTRALNQAVKRNTDRFPEDFMFQLSWEEARKLRSQSAILDGVLRSQSVILERNAHIKHRPFAFTEQGVAMLSSVLHSKRAVQVNVEIMRTFVRLRGILSAHKDLARRLDDLEKKYDKQFSAVFDAIRQLMNPPEPPSKGLIGFHRNKPAAGQGVSEPEPGKEPSLGRRRRRRPKRALAAVGYR